MKRFVVCRGLPASGKSTWAEKQVLAAAAGQAVRINRDLLRKMLHAGRWKGDKTEKPTTLARDAIIEAMMARGTDLIICDDTNLSTKVVGHLEMLAQRHGYAFEIQDFTDVPINTCIERDLKRFDSVGEQVIRRMHGQYLATQPAKPPEYVEGLPECILVDVDGTLAKMADRSPYEWQRVSEDTPIIPIVLLVDTLRTQGQKIVYLSGRDGSCYDKTNDWLIKHTYKAWEDPLFMRTAGDQRKDSIVKRELYEANILGHYNVTWVLDDRDQVVEMWRSLGLTCLQVAPGAF